MEMPDLMDKQNPNPPEQQKVEPENKVTAVQDENPEISWQIEMWNRILNVKIDFSSAIPMATTCLVFLGAFDIYHYYSLFGINVIPFLEPIELIFSFANLLPLALFTFIFGILFILASQLVRIPKYGYLLFFVIMIMFMTVGNVFLGIIFNINVVGDYLGGSFQFVLASAIIIIYGPGAKLKSFMKVSLVFVVISLYLAAVGSWKGRQILTGKIHRYDVELIFESHTIKTGNQLFYIGTTKAYVFFWNDKLQRSVIYPLSGAQSMQIRDNIKIKNWNDYITWYKTMPHFFWD